jgi:hypothetical protein
MVRFVVNGQRGSKNILISIGLTLIVISMLVFWQPKLFAFVFAGIVGLLGIGALLRGIMSKPSNPPGNGPYKGYQNNTEDGSYQEVDD